MDRKEQILVATMSLAAQKGLRNVTLSQIAQKIGIKKASLYNHYASKEEIIAALYEYLREQARKHLANSFEDIGALIRGKTALEVLTAGVENYWQLITQAELQCFYKLTLSERVFSKEAADILCRETERMILSTKQLFYAMQVHRLLQFQHIDVAALSYAMTVHGLIERQLDREMAGFERDNAEMNEYLRAFCDENACK